MNQEMVKAEVAVALEMAEEFYGMKFPKPSIVFSNRMTSCGGRCTFKILEDRYILTFSLPIMRDNDIHEYIARTVYHECAHLIQHAKYGKMDHKDTFSFVMRKVLKRTAKQSTRCHNYKTVPRQKTKRFSYRCKACGTILEFTQHRHTKAQRYLKEYGIYYSHSACGRSGKLVYIEN